MDQEQGEKRPMAVKVYVVLQHRNIPLDDGRNSEIIAARLTRSSAQEIVNMHPGTWIEKWVATKGSYQVRS